VIRPNDSEEERAVESDRRPLNGSARQVTTPGTSEPVRQLRSTPSQAVHSTPLRIPPTRGATVPVPTPDSADAAPRSHARNASHSIASPGLKARPGLRQKKSLPDLRQSHAQILDERLGAGGPPTPSTESDRSHLSPATPRSFQDSPSNSLVPPIRPMAGNLGHSSSARAAIPMATTAASLGAQAPFQIPLTRSHSDRPAVTTTTQSVKFFEPQRPIARRADSPAAYRRDPAGVNKLDKKALADDAEQQPAGVVGGLDRNSGAYFRRLSMLPASTISKAVPLALLHFIDAIRGILFSLSQIHSALKQFVVFATQDGFLPGALAKVMTSADASMGRLIDSLDRFDSSARRSAPDGAIVKEVFENCRDNVGVFSKLVSVLAIQLKVLVNSADVRYTRTLLLMLYGSMGEVARSWDVMASMAHGLKAMIDDPTTTITLHPPTPSPRSDVSDLASSTTAAGPGPGSTVVAAAAAAAATATAAAYTMSARPPPLPPLTTAVVGPPLANKSKARRHAGSFSVEDVQLGAAMPPASNPPEPLPPVPAFAAAGDNYPQFPPPPATPTIPSSSSSSVALSPSTSPTSMKTRPGAPRSVTLPPPPPPIISQSSSSSSNSNSNNAMLYADIFTHLNEMPPTPVSAFGPSLPAPAASSSLALEPPSILSSSMPASSSSQPPGVSMLASSFSSSMSSSASTMTTSSTMLTRPTAAGMIGTGRPTTPRSVGTRGVDEDFLDMVDATTNIALGVCSMVTETLMDASSTAVVPALVGETSGRAGSGDGGSGGGGAEGGKVRELLDLCETGNEVSRRLRASLAHFRDVGGAGDDAGGGSGGGGFRWSRASLGMALAESTRIWDDSNAFVKVGGGPTLSFLTPS
jgi:uncharacterized membrane protein YgcG